MDFQLTGIPGLDEITGGLPPNGLTMVVGTPGTGKTVLSMQMAMHAARNGGNALILTVFSEPHEKLLRHMSSFSFYDESLIGEKIQLLSLKSALADGLDAILRVVVSSVEGKQSPLIVLDGYRGLRTMLGEQASQQFLSALSSQLPYRGGSCVVSSEADPLDVGQYGEMTSADAIILLTRVRAGAAIFRDIRIDKLRGHSYREGRHGFDITADGVEVYPRLATSLPDEEPHTTGRRLGFGLPELDSMLDGGVPQFSTTLVFGDPGTGKSTLALHFAVAGAEAGEPTLLMTFRESAGDLLRKSDELGMRLRQAVAAGSVRLHRQPPIEINPDKVAWEMRQMILRDGVQRVIIDGVNELERAAAILGAESDYLAALLEMLRRLGTTTVMLRDALPPLTGELDSPVVPVAHNRIILRRVEYQANLYRICSVLNMQASDHDTGIHEFRIGQGGIRVLPQPESEPGVLAGIARAHPLHGS